MQVYLGKSPKEIALQAINFLGLQTYKYFSNLPHNCFFILQRALTLFMLLLKFEFLEAPDYNNKIAVKFLCHQIKRADMPIDQDLAGSLNHML